MRIAIIGAGVAGLTTAKTLQQAGHVVTVFDRTPDVGGVWSSTRRYPGVTTQSPMRQYSFSDFPAPKDLPEWPSGEQVQRYLADYSTANDLDSRLRLRTEVVRAHQTGVGWRIELHDLDTLTESAVDVDAVVVANGIFCEPNVPSYPGRAEFEAAGGRVLAGSELGDVEEARAKHVVVVGYGKSACDITVALSQVAATTDVIARQLLWKVPRKIAGVVNFKMLLLTRLGEALFRYHTLRGLERFLHGPGNPIRRRMLNSIRAVSVNQYGLRTYDLVPRGQMEDIVKGAIGLGTEGFFEGVARGAIRVHRDQVIERMLEKDSRPMVELRDGTLLDADLVVCATGYRQGVPFLDDDVQASILDADGNFVLYRQIRPIGVAGLYFNGYNSSFFSPLNAEMAGLWIAADIAGTLNLPEETELRRAAEAQLSFLTSATNGHHSHGGKIIPFSMHNVDEVLGDLGVNIPRLTRASHWLNPINPAAYRQLSTDVITRLSALDEAAQTTGA